MKHVSLIGALILLGCAPVDPGAKILAAAQARSAQASDTCVETSDEGNCVPFVACLSTGQVIEGRAFGQFAGLIEARSNDGLFCGARWSRGQIRGVTELRCNNGDGATLLTTFVDPESATSVATGQTQNGEFIVAASGRNAARALRRGGLPGLRGTACTAAKALKSSG